MFVREKRRVLLLLAAIAAIVACNNPCLYYNDDFLRECEDGFVSGSILLVVDTAGGDGFCHAGITECVDTASYVYEIDPRRGVVRIPFEEFAVEWFYKFDTNYGFPSYVKYYYIDDDKFDIDALFTNLKNSIGVPGDSIDDLSLIKRCFVSPKGKPIFNPNDTTLTLLARSPLLNNYRIE